MPFVRPFRVSDYHAAGEVLQAAVPGYPGTGEELRYQDEHRAPHCRSGRWVAEAGGRVVGLGEYSQVAEMYHPRRFLVNVAVRPEHQQRGIGARLFDAVLAGLQPFDPLTLRATAREDLPRGCRFLAIRGFQEERRYQELRLDLRGPAVDKTLSHKQGTVSPVVNLVPLTCVATVPGGPQRLFELVCELRRDVPAPEPETRTGYRQFAESLLENPALLPEGSFVALRDGEPVGTSIMWRTPAEDELFTGLTGVRRDCRRQGIGLALKLQGIRFAVENGYVAIRTINQDSNAAVLALNSRLGFRKQPAWISLVKDFG